MWFDDGNLGLFDRESVEIIWRSSIEKFDMPDVGFPTFDQLQVFSAVADTGSFSAAARRLGRAQSVISYTVGQLEQQLGIKLFDRSGRVPLLTDAGRALLGDARRATAVVDGLRARAAGLQAGLEADVRIGIDVFFPIDVLTRTLEAFALAYPTVGLHLNVEALGGVVELVASGTCVFAIGTELANAPKSVRQRPIGSVRLVPVAAPDHVLARGSGPVGADAVREATQLVLTDRTALTRGQDFAVSSLRTWRVGDLGAKHALLCAGVGWGNMPEATVRHDLEAGRLVRLDLQDGRTYDYPLSLIQRNDILLGPAATWLTDRLAAFLVA